MDGLTHEELKKAINQVLDERHSIDEVTHKAHHDWVAWKIKREQRHQEIMDAVYKQVIGWGVIVFLGGIGLAVYDFMAKVLRAN